MLFAVEPAEERRYEQVQRNHESSLRHLGAVFGHYGFADWRREAPSRPVVFDDAGVLTEDTVHLHLEQGSPSACSPGSAPRASSITTCRARASPDSP